MNDVEHRLRTLRADPPMTSSSVGDLRARARARRTRRRSLVATAALAVPLALVAAATAIWADPTGDTAQVQTGPGPEADAPAPTTGPDTAGPDTAGPADPGDQRVLGDLSGVEVEVSPRTDLRDGDSVRVTVTAGFDQLDDPVIVQCAGDVTPENVTERCELGPLPAATTSETEFTVARILSLPVASSDWGPAPFDCATEPAGCVIAVGEQSPPHRGVAVPFEFGDVPMPTPAMTVTPDEGLADGQQITVEARGLRPNSTFLLHQCEAATDQCDNLTFPQAETGADGTLRTNLTVVAALYTFEGPVDCTSVRCSIQVSTMSISGREGQVDRSVSFADGVEAPVPELAIEPPGPYRDQQEVTLVGRGFPPGVDVGDQLAQCPADLDPAKGGCSRPSLLRPVVVADDGTFTASIRLDNWSVLTGTCSGESGCVVSWLLPSGVAAASVPLTFEP